MLTTPICLQGDLMPVSLRTTNVTPTRFADCVDNMMLCEVYYFSLV
ncbi:protein of unknown function [Petrocella atlantisensis]|uniref:Uncharacterized protein n=1 Tax=Petrocella atlantisensis TaxID=2173034 RepID=A0A3P7P6J7_9FIRM|nr:protein of unknown function [Petrocella atlantisensis]